VRIALDSNILAYAEGVDGLVLQDAALQLVTGLPRAIVVLPLQVLGELYNVLIRKAGRSREAARDALLKWRDGYAVIETSASIVVAAADLATDHRLQIWDAVILSAAAHAGCRLLLSEDLQDGFTWSGVTVTNPFAERHPLLQAVMAR
jgi:predicted nucleic acid-binding protein